MGNGGEDGRKKKRCARVEARVLLEGRKARSLVNLNATFRLSFYVFQGLVFRHLVFAGNSENGGCYEGYERLIEDV